MVEHHVYIFNCVIYTKHNFTCRKYHICGTKIRPNHVSLKLGLFSYFECFLFVIGFFLYLFSGKSGNGYQKFKKLKLKEIPIHPLNSFLKIGKRPLNFKNVHCFTSAFKLLCHRTIRETWHWTDLEKRSMVIEGGKYN